MHEPPSRDWRTTPAPSLRACVTALRFRSKYSPERFTWRDLSTLVAMEAELAARQIEEGAFTKMRTSMNYPHCRKPHRTLRNVLSCHPRESHAYAEYIATHNTIMTVFALLTDSPTPLVRQRVADSLAAPTAQSEAAQMDWMTPEADATDPYITSLAREDDRDGNAIRGLVIAVPLALLLWALIILACVVALAA